MKNNTKPKRQKSNVKIEVSVNPFLVKNPKKLAISMAKMIKSLKKKNQRK